MYAISGVIAGSARLGIDLLGADRAHQRRRRAHAARRERRVRAGELDRRDLDRAQRHAQVQLLDRRQRQAEARRHRARVGQADLRQDLDGDGVDRMRQRGPHAHRAQELLLVVLRLPQRVDLGRIVDHRRRGDLLRFDPRRVVDRLERRPRLPARQARAIEAARVKLVAAHQRQHLARRRIQHHHRRLRPQLERERRRRRPRRASARWRAARAPDRRARTARPAASAPWCSAARGRDRRRPPRRRCRRRSCPFWAPSSDRGRRSRLW